jgi:hypothetical protein
MLPEFVVSHWWERLLHNATSVTIREALYQDQVERGRGRPVISVPYRIGDTPIYKPETVPAPEPEMPLIPASPADEPASTLDETHSADDAAEPGPDGD